jgi:hypothetical protein
VPDRAIADAIRKRVRILCRQNAGPGDCRVTVAPSETRGEWDLGIWAPSGWQLDSFTEPVERLPEVIERKLRERLVLPMSRRLDDGRGLGVCY